MTAIAAAVDWQRRVLECGILGAGSEGDWRNEAYRLYSEKLRIPDYPCFFGQAAEVRGQMLYTFVSHGDLHELVTNMRCFVSLIAAQAHNRSGLAAFFEPDPSLREHAQFVARFWETLQYIHEHDSCPKGRSPEDPLWEFSFGTCEMFVVGCSPTYQNRRSRNLGPGMILIFQPRHLFIDSITSQPIEPAVRHRIHRRMLAYDGMPVHPDIGFYGVSSNREWRQYALPDDNLPELGACPFHPRQ